MAVVGQVGSGKTSLISSLLGELTKRTGRIRINVRIMISSRQTGIKNCESLDNINTPQTFNDKIFSIHSDREL